MNETALYNSDTFGLRGADVARKIFLEHTAWRPSDLLFGRLETYF